MRPRRAVANYNLGDQPFANSDPLGLLQCTIDVTWTEDDKVFRGVVKSFHPEDDTYKVVYEDNQVVFEDLSDGNFTLIMRPSFRETGHLTSTRNGRLAWNATQ